MSKQAARQKFAHRLEVSDLIGDAAESIVMVPRLSACLEAAQAAAAADDSVTSTHHLLLGLLHAGGAANIPDRLGVTREKVREASTRLFEPVSITGADGRKRRAVGDGEPMRRSPRPAAWPHVEDRASSEPNTCCSASRWTPGLQPEAPQRPGRRPRTAQKGTRRVDRARRTPKPPRPQRHRYRSSLLVLRLY